MIIINLSGQLGNQMFQYALGRKISSFGLKVKYDKRSYTFNPQFLYSLDIFNIQIEEATKNEIYFIRDERRTYLDRIRRKFWGRRKDIISEIPDTVYRYRNEVFETKRAYIDGYWQSEKYFDDIKEIIISDFKFPKIIDNENLAYMAMIQKNISISIHIRRGDYVGGFPLLTKDYYDKAVSYFQTKYGDVTFFVFSNDMEWAKQNIKADKLCFVECNTGKDSWKDMYLMTQCKHNIIANSSFSWWGAWLNQNKDKEVIAPSLWLYHADNKDMIYCEGWKIIDI